MLHIKAVKYIIDYKIWVAFDDGTSGEVDLKNVLVGKVFEPIQDINFFRKVTVAPELETVV